MEDDMDIDDLFGDGAGLPLPSQPPPKELFQRLDELRRSGCCQTIAWSKWGSIASIPADGAALEFRSLRCHPRDGTWSLSDPTIFAQSFPSPEGGLLQHLSWSPNGCDLAVVDAAGRVSILTIQTAMNKPSFSRSSQMDTLDELNAVVGSYWLNLLPVSQRPPLIHRQAVKSGTAYSYDMSQAVSIGPCHPNPQKSALINITASGVLRLLWPQGDAKWYETTSEIETIVSSDDLITHASICAEKTNTLLVAFATTTKQLRLVRVIIKWGNKAPDKEKPMAPAQIIINPQIMLRHLAVTNWMDGIESPDSFHMQPSMVALSHLTILPPSPDGPDGHSTLPTILTVRSHLPTSPSHYNQDTHSIVDRWELREAPQAMHPAFEQLNSRRSSAGTQPGSAVLLKKIDGFSVGKVIIAIESIAFDRILCVSYSDGSIEYRDRSTLSELFMDGGLDSFSHISQLGFSFDDDEPCLQVAMSPTSCSAVKLCTNGKLRWKAIAYQTGRVMAPADEAQYMAIVAGLAMSCSTAIMGSVSHDDLLAIARTSISLPTFRFDWLLEICRVLKFVVDYSEESHHDTLIRNPSIQLCLSIQNSLGFNGINATRDFGAKIAWIGLQTRNCVVLMTMASSMKIPDPEQQRKLSGLEDAEAVRILSGSVRWCFDLMAYLVDCLLHPADGSIFKALTDPSAQVDINEVNNRLQASHNMALHLLLSSATRGFLTVICRRLTHLDYIARKTMSVAAQNEAAVQQHQQQDPHGVNPPQISADLTAAYSCIATLTDRAIVPVRTFETLLAGLSSSIREAYASTDLVTASSATQQGAEKSRNGVEQAMLFGGALPEALIPALRHLFTSLLPSLRSDVEPSQLFFHNFDILAMGDDDDDDDDDRDHDASAAEHRPHGGARRGFIVDIFQRLPIALDPHGLASELQGQRWRRCARCAAVMEDVHSRKPAVAFLIMQQRRCFCGGYWLVLNENEMIA
ncbi:MAG: mediator complex subunit [Claussenomyces sp. TS43310]|nr:MAG: mediator complex subunit [Claussenomyces sp. TS43310]